MQLIKANKQKMSLNFLELCSFLGVVLSCFLVLLIWSSKSFRTDVHLFFSLAIISLNFNLTIALFENLIPEKSIFEIINWGYLFPFAFLIYILKALKFPIQKNKKIWLLALPCFITSSFQFIDYAIDYDIYEYFSAGDDQIYNQLINRLSFGQAPYAITLLGFAFIKIWRASDLYSREKKWLYFNTVSILIFYIFWFLSDYFAAVFDFPVWDYLLALLGLFLVVTAYQGVHQLNVFEQQRQLNKAQKAAIVIQENSAIEANSAPFPKKNSYIDTLDLIMKEDLLYLDPNLSRTIVADKLGISKGYLSELISKNFDCNFNDYLNAFRVARAIEMLNNERFNMFSIEAIGYESGFKSKSVFYNAFKKNTGKTPGAYRQGH